MGHRSIPTWKDFYARINIAKALDRDFETKSDGKTLRDVLDGDRLNVENDDQEQDDENLLEILACLQLAVREDMRRILDTVGTSAYESLKTGTLSSENWIELAMFHIVGEELLELTDKTAEELRPCRRSEDTEKVSDLLKDLSRRYLKAYQFLSDELTENLGRISQNIVSITTIRLLRISSSHRILFTGGQIFVRGFGTNNCRPRYDDDQRWGWTI